MTLERVLRKQWIMTGRTKRISEAAWALQATDLQSLQECFQI